MYKLYELMALLDHVWFAQHLAMFPFSVSKPDGPVFCKLLAFAYSTSCRCCQKQVLRRASRARYHAQISFSIPFPLPPPSRPVPTIRRRVHRADYPQRPIAIHGCKRLTEQYRLPSFVTDHRVLNLTQIVSVSYPHNTTQHNKSAIIIINPVSSQWQGACSRRQKA